MSGSKDKGSRAPDEWVGENQKVSQSIRVNDCKYYFEQNRYLLDVHLEAFSGLEIIVLRAVNTNKGTRVKTLQSLAIFRIASSIITSL